MASNAFRYGKNYNKAIKQDFPTLNSALYVSLLHLQRAMLTLNVELQCLIADVAKNHLARYFKNLDFIDET